MTESSHVQFVYCITKSLVCHTLAFGRNFSVLQLNYRARICKRLMSPRNRFQGIDSASLRSLAGRYDKQSYRTGLPSNISWPIWNRFLGTLKRFYKFGLRVRPCKRWVWLLASFRQVILVTHWLGGLGPTSLVLGFCSPLFTGWQGYCHIFHRVTRYLCLLLHFSIVRKNLWKYFTEYNNTFWNWLSDDLTTRLDLIHIRQDLIHARLDLIYIRLGLIHNSARSHQHSARSPPPLGVPSRDSNQGWQARQQLSYTSPRPQYKYTYSIDSFYSYYI